MAVLESKKFEVPHEVREYARGRLELVRINGSVVGRARFEPGWRWSKDMASIAGTPSCRASHYGYQVSGIMHLKMDDGTEGEVHAGEAYFIPPGHDGWVVGNEPVITVDFTGMPNYAKRVTKKKSEE